MMRRCLGLALLICGSACAVDSDEDEDGATLPDSDVRAGMFTTAPLPEDGYDACEHLPADGPCALVCDHEALVETIPEDTCAVFMCDLTDGHTVTVHACRPPS